MTFEVTNGVKGAKCLLPYAKQFQKPCLLPPLKKQEADERSPTQG